MDKKFYVMMAVLAFATGSMDVNAVYTLDGIEVSADRKKDQFGNMITEQSYYRTGGDVQVIDSDTIEKRHYTQVGDALKYIPGVQVQTPGGYRGGEYGYTQTHSIVTINGDARELYLLMEGAWITMPAEQWRPILVLGLKQQWISTRL